MGDTVDSAVTELFSVDVHSDWSISLHVNAWVVLTFVVGAAAYIGYRWYADRTGWKNFEIDEAEVGIGTSKLKFKPNLTDRQVAYSIWVELSTRKIGLPIDFDNDVVAEVYDSWHSFFSVTRELIKTIPVMKVRRRSTQKIIRLSIEVLNEGLRPHLTKWQARFRRWYEDKLEKKEGGDVIDPQEIQKKFPKWDELTNDMQQVNERLIKYREKMRELVLGA